MLIIRSDHGELLMPLEKAGKPVPAITASG